MRQLCFTLTFFILIVTSHRTAAQETAQPAPAKEQANAQRKKAVELLNLTISEVHGLKLPENRILLLTQAAGLLWGDDEKQARVLVQEISETLKPLFANADNNHPQARFSWLRRNVRQQAIQKIAQLDLDLALEVLRNTRPALPAGEAVQQEINAQEITLEQSLAAQAAANSPAVAVKLAEQTLEKGFSYELGNLIEIIARKDRPAAAKLLEQSLKKLQPSKLLQDQQAVYFALNVLQQEFRARQKELSPGERMYGGKQREPILSVEELKKWNEALCQIALRFQPLPESVKDEKSYALLIGLQRLLPDIEKYNPEYVAPINKLLAKLLPMLPEHTRDNIEINQYSQKGDVEGLLAVAEKAPKEKKERYYVMAVFSAVAVVADFDLARKIINDHITDPYRKKDQIALVEWVAAQAKADEGKIDEAIASLAGLENDVSRADTMATIAESVLQKGNKKVAVQLLERAYQYLNGQAETDREFSALARIVKGFVEADPKRAFEMYEAPLDSLNQTISALTVVCRYDTSFNRCFSVKDELLIGGNLMFTQGIINYVEAMQGLGREDFMRAIEIAGRFRNSEIRSYARLLVLAAVLR